MPVELRSELSALGVTDRPAAAPPDIPATIQVGARIVRLDGWERMVLRAHGLGADARGRRWPTLVACSVALRLRAARRTAERAGQETPETRAARVDEHLTDAAYAAGLLRQLEWMQRRLTDAGESRLATRLTEVIDDVDRIAAGTRVFLGDADPGRSGASGEDGFPDSVYRGSWPDEAVVVGPGPDPALPQSPPDRTGARLTTLRLRFDPVSLLLIAVAAAIVAATVWLMPLGAGRPSATAAGLGPLFRMPAVVDASAESGTVTVTIDPGVWEALPEVRRAEARARIAETARDAGYSRLDLRTTDGRTLVSD